MFVWLLFSSVTRLDWILEYWAAVDTAKAQSGEQALSHTRHISIVIDAGPSSMTCIRIHEGAETLLGSQAASLLHSSSCGLRDTDSSHDQQKLQRPWPSAWDGGGGTSGCSVYNPSRGGTGGATAATRQCSIPASYALSGIFISSEYSVEESFEN